MAGPLSRCVAAWSFVVVVGCTAADLPFDDQGGVLAVLPQAVVGATTRVDMLLALGVPVERFEGDRVLCWRLATDADGDPVPVSLFVSPYYGSTGPETFAAWVPDPRVRIEPSRVATLVLVFDDRGVLQRARLLRQRES